MNVGVVGAGLVGGAAGYAMVLRGSCTDLVLVDLDAERAHAEAADISHAAPVSHPVRVRSGGSDYAALAGSAVVVVTAGANQKPGEDRLELVERNAEIFRQIIPQIASAAPQAVLLIASNPVDILTALSAKLAPHSRVLGSGTVLDSARFRSLLSGHIGASPQSVHAHVLGEHGESEVLAWSSASVGGIPLAKVLQVTPELRGEVEQGTRQAAAQIITGKGATNYGVGAALALITEAILKDRRAVLTVSGPSPYGPFLSLPRIVGAGGVLSTLTPDLDPAEELALRQSAEALAQVASALPELR
ncbi:lactate/malate family dehydrogenase [Deinococcus altitudinis]|uniref:lactate/malate family dehydrogenase n=1 Tax=Deinococcus altitudinis TaxID=468914 RepID=UPI0038928582